MPRKLCIARYVRNFHAICYVQKFISISYPEFMCRLYIQKIVPTECPEFLCCLYFQKFSSILCPDLCVGYIYRNLYWLYVQNFCVSCMSRNVYVAVRINLNTGWINHPLLRRLLTASAINFGLKVSVIVWTINLSSSNSAISKNKINYTERQKIILTKYGDHF
jgi:hypothetical protein